MNNLKGKTIAYQGAPGSYSYQCISQNSTDSIPQGFNTFEGAIQAVQNGTLDYALLPVENSTAGRVADMHHLLAHSQLYILAEYYHKIEHCLLARRGAVLGDIRRAYSHPMALAQCREFLHTHKIDTVPFTDTAQAAEFVSSQDSLKVAAICADNNHDIYAGLEIIEKNIQDNTDNTTRFFLLSKESPPLSHDGGEYTTAIFFTVKNIPAALFKSLSGFATNGVNVTKLESFMPLRGNGSARFYIEIDGTTEMPHVVQALRELDHYASKVERLGTFKKAQ